MRNKPPVRQGWGTKWASVIKSVYNSLSLWTKRTTFSSRKKADPRRTAVAMPAINSLLFWSQESVWCFWLLCTSWLAGLFSRLWSLIMSWKPLSWAKKDLRSWLSKFTNKLKIIPLASRTTVFTPFWSMKSSKLKHFFLVCLWLLFVKIQSELLRTFPDFECFFGFNFAR